MCAHLITEMLFSIYTAHDKAAKYCWLYIKQNFNFSESLKSNTE